MRSKEEAQDYRYFPDPDLLPVEIPARWIDEIRAALPALPRALRETFRAAGLSAYDAALLTESREKAEFFLAARAGTRAPAKTLANWVNGELSAVLNDRERDFAGAPVAPAHLAHLLDLVEDGTLSAKAAKQVLGALADGEGDIDAIVAHRGLTQISDAGAIESAVDAVIAAHAKLVADYRAGKEKAFNALVGQVMRATGGKANPAQVNEILKRRLSSS
jgi:aspartyl-tRNA(Asn)/glutamyl-tRNA(Gln) amidotransferase subunit B